MCVCSWFRPVNPPLSYFIIIIGIFSIFLDYYVGFVLPLPVVSFYYHTGEKIIAQTRKVTHQYASVIPSESAFFLMKIEKQ